MRVIARSTLVEFSRRHTAAQASLDHWYRLTAKANWSSIGDVVSGFSKAKALNAERVRFEAAGGSFRLIVAYDFNRQIAFVKFVGTHESMTVSTR